MSTRVLELVLALSALTMGCDDDTATSPSAGPPLSLSFTGLTPLQGGFHYEGWAIIAGQPFSTGKFNVAADGSLRTVSGAPIAGGALPTNVDVGIASADGPGTNETSGIWFIDPSSGTPSAGLSLPVLPAGWEYEGWTVIGITPLTTGKFLRPAGADFAAPFSGPQPGPPFPGEDYLRNAPAGLAFPRHLGGAMAVITIEPSPDDSPAPFSALRPLLGPIPAGATSMVPFPLANGRAEFARGIAGF